MKMIFSRSTMQSRRRANSSKCSQFSKIPHPVGKMLITGSTNANAHRLLNTTPLYKIHRVFSGHSSKIKLTAAKARAAAQFDSTGVRRLPSSPIWNLPQINLFL